MKCAKRPMQQVYAQKLAVFAHITTCFMRKRNENQEILWNMRMPPLFKKGASAFDGTKRTKSVSNCSMPGSCLGSI